MRVKKKKKEIENDNICYNVCMFMLNCFFYVFFGLKYVVDFFFRV